MIKYEVEQKGMEKEEKKSINGMKRKIKSALAIKIEINEELKK